MKYKMILPVYEQSNTDSDNNFTVRCIVNNIIEKATAPSKQKAKQNSAKQMIQRLTDLKLIHDDKLNATCIPQVSNSPTDFHILQPEALNFPGENEQSTVTEKGKNHFLNLKKNVEITTDNQKDLLITNFHETFGNSFDITRRQKFQLYYKSLKLDEPECVTEHLECILENISKILDIKITKSIVMSEPNKFIVCYTFNETPPLEEIGVGENYNEALKSALIRTIKVINLLLL